MTKIIGTIEARMGSSRLPGKTMMPIHAEQPLLACVVRRFRACRSLEDVVVATTVEAADDIIAEWCAHNGVTCFRGSEENVLLRVVGAAQAHDADAIVQMGADSAYLDYQLIDHLVNLYRQGNYDYICNDLKLTYPLGIYGHVVRVAALAGLLDKSDLTDADRSDVVRYIWERPEIYPRLAIEAPAGLARPQLRLTIDYPEDLAQARALYAHFGGALFTTDEILALADHSPEMFAATSHLIQHSAPFLAKA